LGDNDTAHDDAAVWLNFKRHKCQRQLAAQDLGQGLQGVLRPRHRVFNESDTAALSSLTRFGSRALRQCRLAPTEDQARNLFARSRPTIRMGHPQPSFLPPEIVEMIIFHLTDDNKTLKACAATCIIWHNVVTPHLHRTLTLWSNFFVPDGNGNARRNPLPILHQLGLLSLVKELQFSGTFPVVHWVTPAIFHSRNMRFLLTMENLRELRIADLDFSGFPTGLGECLGHFSPTVRSVVLRRPNGTRRQLLDFFRLFPTLDDVEVLNYSVRWEGDEVLDDQLVPMSGGLRGQLTLHSFGEEVLFEDMVVAFGGMRFASMDLRNVRGIQSLVEACAHTLETLRIYPDDISNHCKSVS
jgi:hypothetical protein